MKHLPIVSLILLLAGGNASAHEFWIGPHDYRLDPGQDVVADLLVGQEFQGYRQAYIPDFTQRFELIGGERTVPVTSRAGDRPALSQPLAGPGLWVIVHETSDFRLFYDDAETFRTFVRHKDLRGTLEAHAARGLPAVGFSELYRRFAKSLVALGPGEGQDRQVGLRAELVAEVNPYAPGFDGQMRVRMLFEGAPRADQQIEVFERAATGEVAIATYATDAEGRAAIAVQRGREYLLDAVVMLPLEADDPATDPVWHSLWASLSFAVPD